MQRLDRFVRQHALRDSIPVSLEALKDLFDVRYRHFSPRTLGFAFEGMIGINANLHPYEQRAVLAHEAVHLLLHHPNSLFLCKVGNWWYNKFELEAQRGAAFLLVPLKTATRMAAEGCPVWEMAEYFEVPADLIELRFRMGRIRC